jgi:hypothetical protein
MPNPPDIEIPEPSLESIEATKRIAKLDLETEKLRLEMLSLARQLSGRGLVLEYLKSIGVLAALLGVAVTLYIGFAQVRESEQNRLTERFDKALTRLASDNATERITGVSALRLFLSERDSALQTQALHFLVNAASIESDPLVQAAILDVFHQLKTSGTSQSTLDETLTTVVQRNKSLARSIEEQLSKRIVEDQKQTIAQYAPLKLQMDQIPTPIPMSLSAKLPLEEYLKFLEAERGPFDLLEPRLAVPLHSLAQLITTLLAVGARGTDFSGIYCNDCDFTKSGDLRGAKFDDAYLEHANFSHLSLRNASFKRSHLSNTIFFAADLYQSDLTNNVPSPKGIPLFECADLRGADLSGTPLLMYNEQFQTTGVTTEVFAPRMLSALIDRATKLESFGVIVVRSFSDSYLRENVDVRFVVLKGDLAYRDENSLLEHWWSMSRPEYRRRKTFFSVNEGEYNQTNRIQYVRITRENVSRIRLKVRPWLRGLLNQPPLTLLSLLSTFSNTVGDSSEEQMWVGTRDYNCNESAIGTAVLDQFIRLRDNPLFDLRVHRIGTVETTQNQLSTR